MLTFTRFGRKGRLGNQLFHLAGMLGLGKKYNQKIMLPPWDYAKHFNVAADLFGKPPRMRKVTERVFHYVEGAWDELSAGDKDVCAWLQSERYWENAMPEVGQALSWHTQFEKATLAKAAVDPKDAIAISVRRGDYVDNPNYDLLPTSYYMQALMEHFPDWMDRKILIFSDDIPYCKIHFEGLPNVWFAEGLEGIEQLLVMSRCGGFVIANSTFSWWGAYLAELRDPNVKIVRPKYLFAGELLQRSSAETHWPDRWITYDHKENGVPKRYPMKDVTFTIPVTYDHNDRRENLVLSACLLQRAFDTNIAIGEGLTEKFRFMQQWCSYRYFNLKNFHRTYMLNEMGLEADTPIIANWDADVVVPEVQIVVAIERIRRGLSDGVYPYDGRFARVPRGTWFRPLEKSLDPGIFKNELFVGCRPTDAKSVGGAVIWNKEKFFEGGGENEVMISHAPEDAERWDRYHALGYKIDRIPGQLFHIDHHKGINSTNRHGHKMPNFEELHKIRAMDKPTLKRYTETWRSYRKPHTSP